MVRDNASRVPKIKAIVTFLLEIAEPKVPWDRV